MAKHIPFEIQAEIMKRLPTKSLMQFRSVSKSWKSLIDSPEFIADYSFNHRQRQHLLVTNHTSENSDQKYVSLADDDTFPQKQLFLPAPLPPPTPDSSIPFIIGSSHGLFCLYTYNKGPIEGLSIIKSVVIWNPSLRKTVAIDVPDMIENASHLDIGFGVCLHARDPKIVKIEYRSSLSNLNTLILTPFHFEVYTLRSRVWRSIPAINQFNQSIKLIWGQVVIDGFIYRRAYDDGTNMMSIVSFDIMNEKFMEVSLPNTLVHAHNCSFLYMLNKSLVVVKVDEECENQVYGIWMMESGVPYTFTKLYTIKKPEASIEACFLGFWKKDEPIFLVSSPDSDSDSDELVVNEVNSENFSYVGISCNGISLGARSYMETLLLLEY